MPLLPNEPPQPPDPAKPAEPVTTGAIIQGIAYGVLGVVTAFGVTLTGQQTAAIMLLVGWLITALTAWQVRKRVSPTPK